MGAVAVTSPSLIGSIHFGTKGCLFDFNNNLDHVRNQVLGGFVCDFCTKKLEADKLGFLKPQLLNVLSLKWLGSPGEPKSPAAVASNLNLGYDLFVIRGLKPDWRERGRAFIANETVKLTVKSVSVVVMTIVTSLVFWLLIRWGLPTPK